MTSLESIINFDNERMVDLGHNFFLRLNIVLKFVLSYNRFLHGFHCIHYIGLFMLHQVNRSKRPLTNLRVDYKGIYVNYFRLDFLIFCRGFYMRTILYNNSSLG